MIQLSSDSYAIVDTNMVLKDAKAEPPPLRGVILCANRNSGKTFICEWNPNLGFTHWHPLPVFPKKEK